MKLEPVYLLAPKPKPKSVPTRRAFLIAGVTFAVGTAVGGACGYSLGVASGSGKSAEPEKPAGVEESDPDLESTGDADLDELRKFAATAPLDQLLAKAPAFLTAQYVDYKADPVLWRGVDRLSSGILSDPDRRIDPGVVGILIENIRDMEPPPHLNLRDRIPALRARLVYENQRK